MYKKYIFLSLLPFIISGCVSSEPKMSFSIPEHIEQMPEKTQDRVNNTGSLFGSGDSPIFSDRKAMRVNDLVTVVITESVESSSEGEKKLEKDTTIDLGGGVFVAPDSTVAASGVSKGLAKIRDKINALSNVGFQTSSTTDFEGKGSNTRSETFSTKITARVLKVMTNDTYYIEGTRELLIDGEKQFIRIGGIIRADDISKNNTVDSQYLADAKILYYTEGDIKNTNKKGWLTKTIETAWPF